MNQRLICFNYVIINHGNSVLRKNNNLSSSLNNTLSIIRPGSIISIVYETLEFSGLKDTEDELYTYKYSKTSC
jgi:hypothetical protein